jgi:hypothetical protein
MASIRIYFLVDSCDLNQDTFNLSIRFHIIPEFGPSRGYFRCLPSKIRGSKFHSIDMVKNAFRADLEATLNFKSCMLKRYVRLWILDLMIMISNTELRNHALGGINMHLSSQE